MSCCNCAIKPRRDTPRARLGRELDRLWARAIRMMCHHHCMVCGAIVGVQAAHLVSKGSNPFLRWELLNGILLCHHHHDCLDGRAGAGEREKAWAYIRCRFPRHYKHTVDHRHKQEGPRSMADLEAHKKYLLDALELWGRK